MFSQAQIIILDLTSTCIDTFKHLITQAMVSVCVKSQLYLNISSIFMQTLYMFVIKVINKYNVHEVSGF